MKDRKEYYKKYNNHCAFINLRFNLVNDDDYILYRSIVKEAKELNITKSKLVKYYMRGYRNG